MVYQLRLQPFGGSEPVKRRTGRARRAPQVGCDVSCGSMLSEIPRFLRTWAEVPSPVLVADEAARLAPATMQDLRRMGFLAPAEPARAVGCQACETDHAEWVESVTGRDGELHHFIVCPEKGRVEVSPQRLQHWAVDFTPLARALKEGLRAFGTLQAVIPGRLWRLGRASLAGRSHELWVVREASAAPGPDLARAIPINGAPAVFFLGWPPSRDFLKGESGVLLDLFRAVHVRGAGLHVDRAAVERRMRALKAEAESAETQLRCCCG